MSTFRGGSTRRAAPKTQKFSDPSEGAGEPMTEGFVNVGIIEHPPILKGLIGVCNTLIGVIANVVQVATSAFAFYVMAMGAAVQTDALKVFFATNVGLVYGCSLLLAAGVQGGLHMNGPAMSSTWHRLRRINLAHLDSPDVREAAKSLTDLKTDFFLLCLVADAIGDGGFVRLLTTNGIFLVAWVLGITAFSTLLMYDGWTRLWGAVADWRAFNAAFVSEGED